MEVCCQLLASLSLFYYYWVDADACLGILSLYTESLYSINGYLGSSERVC
jgi:hypothetical protein